jgi:hypothetical protein
MAIPASFTRPWSVDRAVILLLAGVTTCQRSCQAFKASSGLTGAPFMATLSGKSTRAIPERDRPSLAGACRLLRPWQSARQRLIQGTQSQRRQPELPARNDALADSAAEANILWQSDTTAVAALEPLHCRNSCSASLTLGHTRMRDGGQRTRKLAWPC